MVPFEPGCGEPRAGSGRQCLYRAVVQWAKAGVASAEVAEDADGVLVGSDQDW